MQSDRTLLVVLDVDGPGASMGSSLMQPLKAYAAGYDYALGYGWGSLGLFTARNSLEWPADRRVSHWKSGRTVYFEVSWEQLGGRPESIAFLVVSSVGVVQDLAPNLGVGEIPHEVIARGSVASKVTPYKDLTRDEIEALAVTLSADKINSSQDERNEIPNGTVLIFRTNKGHLGKARIIVNTVPYALDFEFVVYAADGTILMESAHSSVRATYTFDLDTAAEVREGADFWWEHTEFHGREVPGHPVYWAPENGALFAVYRGEPSTQTIPYEQITRTELEGMAATFSADKINSSPDERNEIPNGAVLLFRTNDGHFGKMKILSYTGTFVLNVEFVTFAEDGTTLIESSYSSVRATNRFDLDTGEETSAGADFWWEHTEFHEGGEPGDPAFVVPINGALFAIYMPGSPP
jgi:hypothetical protein